METTGFSAQDVDVNAPAKVEPMGIESEYLKVPGSDKGLVRVEAAFGRDDFCAFYDNITGTDNDPVEIEVVGSFTTGQCFYGTDSVRIKRRR